MSPVLRSRAWLFIPTLLCIFFLLAVTPGSAQTISGTVRSSVNNQPLAGVSVEVKGTANGTTTDGRGYFQLKNVKTSDSLAFTFVGFKQQMVGIGNRRVIDLEMQVEASSLDQVVVIGYGTQKKTSVTASISRVDNVLLDQVPAGRLETALAGRMAGVNITTNRSIPGAAPTIRIRGISSISAANSPLVVIDGFPDGDLGQLNMNDVKSIEVLKDASSAAIYGSRGAGGVILVTTKRGSTGKAKLNLNSYYGVATPMLHDDWLTGEEWYDYLVKYQNREYAWAGGDVTLPIFGDARRPITYQVNPLAKTLPQTIWQDEVAQNAPIQNHNLSINGGNEVVKYYVSGTYANEKGAIKTAGYEKYSFRANLDVRINKVISLGMELSPSYSRRRIAGSNMVSLVKYPPFVSPDIFNGKYPRTFNYVPTGHSGQASPYTFLYGTENYNNAFANIGRAFINLELFQGLSLRTSVGTNLEYNNNNFYNGGIGDPQVASNGSVSQSQTINLVNENVLSYTKTIHKMHQVDVIAGASYQKSNSQSSSMAAVANSFNNDKVKTLNNAVINPSASTSSKTQWGLASYFSRVNYAFDNKYLFAASFRTDGSSRFGKDNKWGYFPSVSLAWRVTQESFMQNIPGVSELKLRASYGVTGNFNIGDFQYLGTVSGVVYSPNNVTANAIAQTSLENAQLSWEKVKGYDLGVELGLFDNRVYINADYYDKRTTGMLYNVNTPAITGFTSTIKNVGAVRNHGVDLEITTKNLMGNFKWGSSFNFSHNLNEVIDLGGVSERVNPSSLSLDLLLRIGQPMFSYYGYKKIGIFQNKQQIANTPALAGTKPGNPIVADMNKDGKIDPKDKVVLGNFQPKYLLGFTNDFSWKGFDLSIAIQASLGAKIFNYENQFYEGNTLGAMRRSLSDRQWWSESDPGDGKSPAAALSQLFGYNTNTDFYIESGSFLNVRNANFGYNLSNFTQKWGVRNLRVYVSASNLIVIKDKDNHAYNPEGATQGEVSGIASTPGFNQGSEPLNRTVVFGLNVGF